MIVEGTKVSYECFEGVVTFVGDNYIVIDIKGSTNQTPARLLIYKHNYRYVQILE